MGIKLEDMKNGTIKIAVVGCGYWGKNLVRNFSQLDILTIVCDKMPAARTLAMEIAPNIKVTPSIEEALSTEIDGVVIATEARTHYDLAKQSLKAGKHVLVEKPLALSSSECLELIDLALQQNRILMVGHTFLYNAAVLKLKECIASGDIGDIYYIYSSRLSLGRIRQDINAMWNFAPHDISILIYLLGEEPHRVTVKGFSYLQPGIEDVVFMTLEFDNNVGANIHISWLDPRKMRQMTVVGSSKMLIYDDTSAEAKIKIYDKGVSNKVDKTSLGDFKTFDEFQLLLRAGDVHVPRIDFTEPLKAECTHFIECIQKGHKPITDGRSGLQVVRVLEAAQRSLDQGGLPQEVQKSGRLL